MKGTQFTVTLRNGKADVAVSRGQVDVTSFRSGQSVLVLPGQRASASAIGRDTLSIGGTGRPQTIRAGTPVTSDVKPVDVPRGGFTKPVVTPTADTPVRRAATGSAPRISGTIGPRINVQQASKGLASAPSNKSVAVGRSIDANREKPSLWKQQAEAQETGPSAGSVQGAMLGNSASAPGTATGAASGAAAGAASGAAGGTGGVSGGVGNAGGVASGVGNAVSVAATAAAGSGGAAVSTAVRAVNRRNNR